jgi:hypothetical protein
VVQTLRELVGQRRTAEEIASVIGTTPGSVRGMCSRLDLPLHDPRPCLRARVTFEVMHKFEREAQLRNMHVNVLAGLLLAAIAEDCIFNAVLDDGHA